MLIRVMRRALVVVSLLGSVGCQKSKPEETPAPLQQTSTPAAPQPVQPSAPPAPPPAPVPPPLASSIAPSDKSVAAQFVSGVGGADALWAWTLGKTFTVDLGVPPQAKQQGARLIAKFAVHDKMIKENHSLTVSAKVGETAMPGQTYTKGGATEYSADVPASALQSDRVRVVFTLDKTFKPGKEELGVMLSGISLSPR